MHWFSDRWVHGPHWREVFTLGTHAAAALNDPEQQATQLNYLAWVHQIPPEDPETTLRYTTQALDLATRAGATAQIAWAHQYAAHALRRLQRLDVGAVAAAGAAEMFKADGDIDAYCQCIGTVGDCLRDGGRYAEALDQYLKMSDLVDDEGSGITPSIVELTRPSLLVRLGLCLGMLGDRAEAITKLTEAVRLMELVQLSGSGARTLEALATVLADEGRNEESRRTYARAAEVFAATGDAEGSSRCHDLATAAN
ncbi:tetratricopeptide repeat protein [Plantactinospora soyae]|uniref:Tetratricopeptide (TPR) repeat protein n=1 Tax=Plantactinospora soyae TaxID=1544732 RepID=A0A927RAS5_9ACTN|nr:tetratricopeptide repeat protein [Plantactinospora soyae]MBE1490996.1 tetratricopeptide (TPR) repeat protein [Plantactinospora soyae]